MLAYIARRVLQTIPILLGVSFVIFILYTKVGEDPVHAALGHHASTESINALRAKWGLDQPLLQQYVNFLKQIVTGDFGTSFTTGEQLSELFAEGAQITLALTVPPFFMALFLNLSAALILAFYRGSRFERYSTPILVGAMSISVLVYIMGFQYIFAFKLGWFPISGYEAGAAALLYLALPWIVSMVVLAGPQIRLFRTIFLDETKADYVRTARAKSCSPKQVMFSHVMKNAMIPITTYVTIELPTVVLSSFLYERFFSIPGAGDTLISAIQNGDFPIIKAYSVLIAITFIFVNLITDILYAYVDPRVQLN